MSLFALVKREKSDEFGNDQISNKSQWALPFVCFFFRGITKLAPFLDKKGLIRGFPVSFGLLVPCVFNRTARGVSSSEKSELDPFGARSLSICPLSDFAAFGANIFLN